MVKYLALAVAVVVSLVMVDMAEAGRRCKSCGGCNTYSGCPGGVCGVPVYPQGEVVPVAPGGDAPPAPMGAAAKRPAPVVAATPVVRTAPQYYTSSVRRGLFGRRR